MRHTEPVPRHGTRGAAMADSDTSAKGLTPRAEARHKAALRSELRNLSDHALLALEMIREGQPPKSTATDKAQQLAASDPELRDIELAVQNLVGALSIYLFK